MTKQDKKIIAIMVSWLFKIILIVVIYFIATLMFDINDGIAFLSALFYVELSDISGTLKNKKPSA
jgi:hypothetical protein